MTQSLRVSAVQIRNVSPSTSIGGHCPEPLEKMITVGEDACDKV